ncbi:MAG TPA: DNA polymerase III subunit delta [Anaerovoracaceae bacterium]|nr:DNA polymerase III subunit delta [Anaerovoracaceae bacterium]
MANKSNAGGEHAYKRIDKDVRSNSVKNLLLLFGREEFLIHWAVDMLVHKYVNEACRDMDFSRIDGASAIFEQIRNDCETLPFLSERRVVLIRDFKLLEEGKTKGFGEEEESLLINYLKHIPENCLLIITSCGADKRKKVFKAISEAGGVYEFGELDEKSLKSYIEKRFREAGKIARPSVVAGLVEASGYYDKDTDYTLYNLENDIKKAIAYNEGAEIGMEAVEKTVSGNMDTDVFAMIDSLGRARKDEAYRILHNLLTSGEQVYKLLALLCSHFEIILSVKEMREEGKSFPEMKEILGIHEFRIKKAASFAEKHSIPQLRKILQGTYEIDKSIKTGLLEPSLALELFIAEI